jgi:hypothetical protein
MKLLIENREVVRINIPEFRASQSLARSGVELQRDPFFPDRRFGAGLTTRGKWGLAARSGIGPKLQC